MSLRTTGTAMSIMAKSYIGRSGRSYEVLDTLYQKPRNPALSLSIAKRGDDKVVLKPVDPSIYEHTMEMSLDFPQTTRLRLPVDWIEAENILVLPYYTMDLFDFMKKFPSLPMSQLKSILRNILLSLEELHQKDWAHVDLKPDNVLMNWKSDSIGKVRIEQVVLGDTDCAAKLSDGRLIYARLGNPMWRSPEGQVGVKVGRHSDIYSFGLVCAYVLFNKVIFDLNLEQLEKDEIEPELEVMFDTVSYLGKIPPELLEYVKENEAWCERLQAINDIFSKTPHDLLKDWDASRHKNLHDNTKKFLLRILQLDPAERLTATDLLKDSWWGN